ncbi:nuclear transport factor 2 family protein [Pedobacter aquatilis]|uniref:nuclear transport factor 2 family protein n=1 Tax=Pedobacter aquatilis TaxID=351343 RepID=UPI0025B5D194|nr:nuclear transport factor 2 family protein [Pedobacter aquatilis]MDN3586981.1 nuclear transport factor 2 family protein [Pedobacter aquatilis]
MKSLLTFIILCAACLYSHAQMDTTSYAKERAEIRTLLRSQKPGTQIDCNDFIAVGPKGDISFTREQWVEAQKKEKLTFKSVRPIPGNEFIRIYDGTMAIVNVLIEVKLVIDSKDVDIKVRRLEVYHKNAGKWCRVAGQGTQVDEMLFPVK